jgi:hypothetical protein
MQHDHRGVGDRTLTPALKLTTRVVEAVSLHGDCIILPLRTCRRDASGLLRPALHKSGAAQTSCALPRLE